MSVIVKGMKMPENCSECPCLRHDSMDGINAYQCNISLKTYDDNSQDMWTKRDADCPLVELPEKHGRLIDGDVFRRKIDMCWPFTKEEQAKHGMADIAKSSLITCLNTTPTIISAEGQ